jgi:hypothetical protein
MRVRLPVAAAIAAACAVFGIAIPALAATPIVVTVTGAQNYGGTPVFVGSTGVSGVTVSGITCATVNRGTPIAPTLTANLAYVIDGNQCHGGVLSDPNYTISGYSGSTFRVFKATLDVTANNASRAFGTTNPTLGYTITGFVNGEGLSVVSGTPSLSTTATASSPVGTYPITVAAGTLSATNYFFSLHNGTLTVSPAQVTVTVTGAQNYGGSPGWSGSTGVPGLTVSGMSCTSVNGGTAIAASLAAGSYSLDDSSCSGGVLSSGNYAISSYTGGSFSVFRVALTVTATDASRVYGAANPSFGYTISGFVNGDDSSIVTGAPALSTTATASSPAGSYPINVAVNTLHAGNYFFLTQAGTLTVNPAPVTVTVTGAQNYGGTPGWAGTTNVPGVTVSGMSCTSVNSGTAIAASLAAGTYTLDGSSCTGGTLSNGNYTIASYTGGSFQVFRVALTVTANDASRVYGAANPSFGYTVTGFVNGDDASVVTGSPTLSTTATAASNVGTYPISVAVNTLHAANYFFVTQSGTLTVNPAPVTVTVTGAQNYGGTPGWAGATGVGGLTVSGMSCTTVSGGTAVAATLAAGGYSLDGSSCSGGVLSSSNYTIASYTGGSFQVFRVALTVTANDASRVYGAANPSFGYTITGFVNGDDASVVSGSPTLSTTAGTASNVGTYPISVAVNTLHAANYFFVTQAGTLTVGAAPLTVTVTGAQNYGGPPGWAGKTSVSGVTVSGMSCTGLVGGVSIAPAVAAGTYTLDATTCGGGTLSSSNYAIGSYTGGSFSVFRIALTVAAGNASRVYGAANPSFGYTISGFVNGDDASVVTGSPALATPATASSSVGTYPINVAVGTLHAANYFFTTQAGTLTVNPAPVAVTVTGSQTYGGTASFTGSTGVSGLTVTGVACNGLTNTASIAPALPAGSYQLDAATCSGGTLSSTNYTISGLTGGAFQVNPAQLSVTVTDASRAYGAANPSFTYTISGFVNGDDASVISGAPAMSTTATASSNPGTYPINIAAGTLSSANYTFSFQAGTLTVHKASLTVAANNASRQFGAADPTFSYAITGFVNGDTATVVSGAPVLSATATQTSDVGTYPINVAAGTLAAQNYAFVLTPGTLTITPTTPAMTTSSKLLSYVSATLTYGPSSTPVVGVTVTFTAGAGNTPACTAITDSTGLAKCTPTGAVHTQILLSFYTASFAGTTDFNAVSVKTTS